MADAKLTALTAASALAAADLFYVSQSAASRKATGTQLLTLVGTTYVPLAGGTMTGALTLPAGAVGTPSLMFTGAGATTGLYSTGANNVSMAIGGVRKWFTNVDSLVVDGAGISIIGTPSAKIRFNLNGFPTDFELANPGTNQLILRSVGTSLSTFPLFAVQSYWTDNNNYERLTLTGVQGASVNIVAETLGTGGDNLDIVLTPAGTGNVKFGTHSALAAETVTGYITIKDAGGTSRKIAVVS